MFELIIHEKLLHLITRARDTTEKRLLIPLKFMRCIFLPFRCFAALNGTQEWRHVATLMLMIFLICFKPVH